jgi:hypothetical protein
MKKLRESELTKKAMRALTEAVAKVVQDHQRRGIPLAVWRDGRAVSIPASEACALREDGSKAAITKGRVAVATLKRQNSDLFWMAARSQKDR